MAKFSYVEFKIHTNLWDVDNLQRITLNLKKVKSRSVFRFSLSNQKI